MQTNTTTTQTTIANNNLYMEFIKQFLYKNSEDQKRGTLLLHFWSWLKSKKGERRAYGVDRLNDGSEYDHILEYSHLTVEGGELWIHCYQGKYGKKLWKQPLNGSTIMVYFFRRNENPEKKIIWGLF